MRVHIRDEQGTRPGIVGHSFLSTRPYPPALAAFATVLGMSAGPHLPSAEDAWLRVDAFFANHLR